MAIVASNIIIEWLFSSCKNVIKGTQTRLGADKLIKLMFLQKNMKVLKKKLRVNLDELDDYQNTKRKNGAAVISDQSMQEKSKQHDDIDLGDYSVNVESEDDE